MPIDCVAAADAEDAAWDLSGAAVRASAPASIVRSESVMNLGEIIIWTAVFITKELYTNGRVLEGEGAITRLFFNNNQLDG